MLKDKDKRIILALADNGMKAKAAARQLNMHYNIVYRHMDDIYMQTDLDPRDFYDLQELVRMVEGEELEQA